MQRKARVALTVVGVLVLVGTLVGIKAKQIMSLIAMGEAYEKSGPPPETISSSVARSEAWEGSISAVGSITPARGVMLSNDAPGVVSRIMFESGAMVRQGQVLVELDTSVERSQIASAQSRLELAELTAKRSRALVKENTIAEAQRDNDDAQLKAAAADLGALRAQMDRKQVRAPFSGRLGIRAINLGQYLNPGTPIAELQAIGSVHVDFSLPQQRLADIRVGMPVRVGIAGAETKLGEGAIAAIDPAVDTATRTFKLRANVPNQAETLRPGMFANVSVMMPEKQNAIVVPVTAVVHASFGDSVFVIEDKKDKDGKVVMGEDGKPLRAARQQFVRTGESRGDFVAITDGIQAGQEVVSAGAFKLRNGSGVVVNNSVDLKPALNPAPENH